MIKIGMAVLLFVPPVYNAGNGEMVVGPPGPGPLSSRQEPDKLHPQAGQAPEAFLQAPPNPFPDLLS